MASDTPLTARDITADLMQRLRQQYALSRAGGPAGMLLEEVGWNGTDNSRRCDALFIGLANTTGRLLIGHELKASRTDWLHELREITKAEQWADQCHQWWLVTVPGVVFDGELPNGWGLMVPGRGSRLKVITPARLYANRVPSWDATRSIVARTGTAQRSRAQKEFRAVAADRLQQRHEDAVSLRDPEPTPKMIRDRLTRIQDALGGELGSRGSDETFTEDELRLAGQWIRARRGIERGRWLTSYKLDQLDERIGAAEEALQAFRRLEESMTRLATEP